MLELIVLIAAAAATIFITWFVLRRKQKNQIQINRAATVLNKEIKLNKALEYQGMVSDNRYQTLLLLSWKDLKKQSYLFDPEAGVTIGRSAVLNDICIRNEAVSAKHCRLYLYQGHLYVEDLGSANGTWIRSGMHLVRIGQYAELYDQSRLVVGGIQFQIRILTYDTTYL